MLSLNSVLPPPHDQAMDVRNVSLLPVTMEDGLLGREPKHQTPSLLEDLLPYQVARLTTIACSFTWLPIVTTLLFLVIRVNLS